MCITQRFYTSIVKKIPSVLNASCAQLLSHICLFATPWIIACQAPLSMEFSRQEYWKGLLFLPPGDLPNGGLNLCHLWLLHWHPPQHSWPPMNIYARISQPQQHGHLGQMIWAVLSIRGYLEASLTSKHLIPTAPSPPIWGNQKCLQTLSNVLWKAKIGPG